MSMLVNSDQPLLQLDVADRDGVVTTRWRQSFYSDLPTLTQQQFVEESDINNIIARYRVQGVVNAASQPPMFGDFSNLPSYQEALDIVNRGADSFMALSSDIRARFENDPAKFLEFASDPVNKDQLVVWGLVPKDMPVPATLDDVVSELRAVRPSEPPEGA